jgi:hypothetical protein
MKSNQWRSVKLVKAKNAASFSGLQPTPLRARYPLQVNASTHTSSPVFAPSDSQRKLLMDRCLPTSCERAREYNPTGWHQPRKQSRQQAVRQDAQFRAWACMYRDIENQVKQPSLKHAQTNTAKHNALCRQFRLFRTAIPSYSQCTRRVTPIAHLLYGSTPLVTNLPSSSRTSAAAFVVLLTYMACRNLCSVLCL